MKLHDFLDYYADHYPDAIFAVQGQRQVSYREAIDQVHQLANAFAASGIGQGDRVAVLSKNSIEYAIGFYAAFKSGVVPVPMNYRLAPPEWVYIVNDSGSKMVIASAEFVEGMDSIRAELNGVGHFVAIADSEVPGWTSYQSLIGSQHATPPSTRVDATDDLLQMYTSGTTGRPKGALVTHNNVCENIQQCSPNFNTERGDRVLIVAPMYHTAAGFCTFLTVSKGGCLYIQEDFIPDETIRALSEESITWALLVPAMIQACLIAVPDVADRNYDGLRTLLYGGSPIAEGTLRRAMDIFQCDFLQAFGMTELSPVAMFLTADDHRRALAEKPELIVSAGRPILGTEARIVDEYDNPVPNGTIGELLIRGPQIMKGYWNLPQETAEVLRDGWMHTGDAGTMDDEGYVYIQDRVKDMIVSGGENVYPRVVEEVLLKHPAVADAAVIGVPDERWGETVKAIIVLQQGTSTTGEEIMRYCRSHLGGFAMPRSVDLIATLPRNASGKVLKRELREPFWQGQGRRVGGS